MIMSRVAQLSWRQCTCFLPFDGLTCLLCVHEVLQQACSYLWKHAIISYNFSSELGRSLQLSFGLMNRTGGKSRDSLWWASLAH